MPHEEGLGGTIPIGMSMRTFLSRSLICVAAVLVASTGVAGPLEGRWKLVEQTYGEGRSDTLELRKPLRLEFVRQGSELVGWSWLSESSHERGRWPSLLTGEGRVRIEKIDIPPDEDRVRARYSATTDSDDRVRLDFVEEYDVGDDRKSLTGTVTISLVRDGRPAGSYVVRRRFVREP